MPTAVDRLYEEFRDASEHLRSKGEISLGSAMDNNARKAILLAAASYFEYRLATDVLSFCVEISGKNSLVPALVKNKAIERQYHTWFDWKKNNANVFYGLFGPEFKLHMEDLLKTEESFNENIRAFLEIGRDRNRLVHEDYATFSLEKTTKEIFERYKTAMLFIDRIPLELRRCAEKIVRDAHDKEYSENHKYQGKLFG